MNLRHKTQSFAAVLLILFLTLAPHVARASTEEIAKQQWHRIQALPEGPNKTEQEETYFDHWAQSDSKVLSRVARSFFEELIRHKQKHKRNYLAELKDPRHPHGPKLARFIESMASAGVGFEKALTLITQGAVEIVLTSHPTQIQSASYRLLWQFYERLKDAHEAIQIGDPEAALIYAYSTHRLGLELTKKGILTWNENPESLRGSHSIGAEIARWHDQWAPILDQLLRQTHPGNPLKLSIEEEARETADVYLPNLYWALPRIRHTLVQAMRTSYGHHPNFDVSRVNQVAEEVLQFSSWAWDADGKAIVKADTMKVSNAIQQSAIYRLHEQRLELILDALRSRLGQTQNEIILKYTYDQLLTLKSALSQHCLALERDPQSTEIVKSFPRLNFHADRLDQFPTVFVQSFFASWSSSILNQIQETKDYPHLVQSLEDFVFEIKAFHLNNHVRQNIEVVHKALEGRDQKTPTYETEMKRLSVLAQDPGRNGAFITADTKTSEDTDAALRLLDLAALTGHVRYFPLIENMDSFRKLSSLVEYWLQPGSLMRRHVIRRSQLHAEPPTLNIMFALSDTNRLGSQAATHLMELMGEEARNTVARMSALYPITPQEKGGNPTQGSFRLKIFWGGGSQLARGGDWISHEKTIYTDQGNARDLKYDSPDMAVIRMDRHLTSGIRQAYQAEARPSESSPSARTSDDEELSRLIALREAQYHELFFDPSGYRNVMEAYLLFGSMLTEARSNSYGARPTSRTEDNGSGPLTIHRLFDRFFLNPNGKSLDELVAEDGIHRVMLMPLKELWSQLRPNLPYATPSIDQRAITIDNTFSETKFNHLAKSVESEETLGISIETSARWLKLEAPHFQSYRRQKVAEVLATSIANLDSHASRLPKSLRHWINDEKAQHFLLESRGKSFEQVSVQDLVGVFGYIHQTLLKVEKRNAELANYLSRTTPHETNPLKEAENYIDSVAVADQKPYVRFGQALLGWSHRNSTFGSLKKPPQDLRAIFPNLFEESQNTASVKSDTLNQLEFLAWALHYEGQQHHPRVNELNPYSLT